MENDLITAAVVVIGVPAVLVGYILLTERLIQALPERRQGTIRPWFWIAPAIAFGSRGATRRPSRPRRTTPL